MKGDVQKTRETIKSEASGCRQTGPVWRSCNGGAQEDQQLLVGGEPLSQLMNWKAVSIAWQRWQKQGKQRWMNWSRPRVSRDEHPTYQGGGKLVTGGE